MATATVVTDLTEVTDCDGTTNGGAWSGSVSASLGTSDPSPLEGTGWIGGILKKDGDDMIFTPTSSIDMSGTHFRWLFISILKPNLKTTANGGITLTFTGSTSGTAVFNLSGSDRYVGGWEIIVINPYATPDSGTVVVGNVVTIKFEIGLNVNAKNVITTQHDWMSYGTGFYVHGGTSGDEIALSHIDTQDVYYLLTSKIKGVYQVTGKVQIGDSTGTNVTWFKDSGKIVIFQDLDVDSDYYEFNVAGNSTGVTHADISGLFITADNRVYSVDFTNANITSVTMDGTIFQNASTIDLGSAVSGDGTVFDGCETIDPGGADLDGCTIKNATVTGTSAGSLMVNVDSEGEACTNMIFKNYTGATTYAVYVASSVTEFDMTNWTFDDPDNTTSYAVYWAGTIGTLTINALGTTNLVTAGCTSAGGTVTVVATKSYTITGLVAGSEVRAYVGTDPDTSIEIDGVESSGTSFQFNHEEGGNAGYIIIHSLGYKSLTIWLTYPSVDASLPVSQSIDRTYENP